MKAISLFLILTGMLITMPLHWPAVKAAALRVSPPLPDELTLVLNNLKSTSRTLKSISAKMKIATQNTQIGGPPELSNADIYIQHQPGKRNDQVKIVYTNGVTIALVGPDAYYYEPVNHRVYLIGRASLFTGGVKVMPDPYAFVSEIPRDYDMFYLGNAQVGMYSTAIIKFTPKPHVSSDVNKKPFTIWVDRRLWIPVKYEGVEGGDVMTVTLTNVRKNVPIPPGVFKLTWPAGTVEERLQ